MIGYYKTNEHILDFDNGLWVGIGRYKNTRYWLISFSSTLGSILDCKRQFVSKENAIKYAKKELTKHFKKMLKQLETNSIPLTQTDDPHKVHIL